MTKDAPRFRVELFLLYFRVEKVAKVQIVFIRNHSKATCFCLCKCETHWTEWLTSHAVHALLCMHAIAYQLQ